MTFQELKDIRFNLLHSKNIFELFSEDKTSYARKTLQGTGNF